MNARFHRPAWTILALALIAALAGPAPVYAKKKDAKAAAAPADTAEKKAVATAPAAVTATPAADPAAPVAQIGGEPITLGQFTQYWDKLPEARRKMYEQEGGKAQFLSDIIRQKVLVREAVAKGLDKKPEVAIELEMARDKVLYKAAYDEDVMNVIVPDADIIKYYEENAPKFTIEETVHARHILVTPAKEEKPYNTAGDDATDEAAAKAKIETIKARLDKGENFEDLAKQLSEDTTAARGGDVGFFARGRMVKPFEEAAFALQPGQTTGIVQTQFGYHIIRVDERRPGGMRGLTEVRTQIFTVLSRDRRDAIKVKMDQVVESLKQKHGVTVNGELLGPAVTSTPAVP